MQESEQSDRVTKFSRQAADLGAVYIYKEGLFARAYNEGAYGFVNHIVSCRPVRRFVKSIDGDRVMCGVPLTALRRLPAFGQASQIDANTWRWPLAVPFEKALYEAWRTSLPLKMPEAPVAVCAVSKPPVADPAQRLIDRLMQFNVAANTPVAALNLVADLQRQWQEREVA